MEYEIRYSWISEPGKGLPVRNLEPRPFVHVCAKHGFHCNEWEHTSKKVSNEILPTFEGEHFSEYLDRWIKGLYLAEDLYIVAKAT